MIWIVLGLITTFILSFLHKRWYWIVPYILLTTYWGIVLMARMKLSIDFVADLMPISYETFPIVQFPLFLLIFPLGLLMLKDKRLGWVYIIATVLFASYFFNVGIVLAASIVGGRVGLCLKS